MKEIGEKLREARESMGVSIEEVASDLKLRPSQIENIEEGNMEAFKDIFYLKYFIRDYSKYLGLSYEDMIDDFNEYLFDHTSRISLDDIKKAKKKIKKDKNKKIASPYTLERKPKFKVSISFIYILIIILLILIGYLIVTLVNSDNFKEEEVVTVYE